MPKELSAFLVFEPGPEGIRGFGEHAGISGKISVSGATGPAPKRFRLADHVTYPCCCLFKALSNSVARTLAAIDVNSLARDEARRFQIEDRAHDSEISPIRPSGCSLPSCACVSTDASAS